MFKRWAFLQVLQQEKLELIFKKATIFRIIAFFNLLGFLVCNSFSLFLFVQDTWSFYVIVLILVLSWLLFF